MSSLTHEQPTDSLTPPLPYIQESDTTVHIYSAIETEQARKMMVRLPEHRAELARASIVNFVNDELSDTYPDILATTPEKKLMEITARDFC